MTCARTMLEALLAAASSPTTAHRAQPVPRNTSPARRIMADVEAQAAAVDLPGDEMALAAPNADVATPAEKKTVKKMVRRKKRPARAQIDTASISSEPPPQTGTIFNIWYNKWSGGDRDANQQTHAKGRCNIAKDSGFTRADQVTGSYFCLRFARGLCPHGQDCEYLHRLPSVYDLYSPNVDCFGREKFADYRDDMGGVGSFMRQNRTIYVGRIHVTDDIEEIVARHFAEWGQIERSTWRAPTPRDVPLPSMR